MQDKITSTGTSKDFFIGATGDGASGSGESSWVLPVIITGATVGFLVLGLAFRWYNQKKLQKHLKALSELASAELGSMRQPQNATQIAPSEVFLEDGQDAGQVEPDMCLTKTIGDLGPSSARAPISHQV